MSQSEDEEVNRREVAYRLFAAEFEDADYSYAESDEERAPNYVVTPTGARVNRVFVVGVLTEVEQVSEDVVRARVVDPTGAFVVYAGQYQPEALAALESADAPSFVAVTGKARTFQPDDADVIYTSIRPETVSEVDAETRDRWVVSTAEQTVDRVETMAAAHERVERGENLEAVLTEAGVQSGLAAGIPLALDHYDTSPAYLESVRELALDAARVVAGERDEAGELSLSPSDGGDAPLDFAAALDVDARSAASGGAADAAAGEGDADAAESATDGAATDVATDETADETADAESETGTVDADFGEPDETDAEVPDGEARAETTAAAESEDDVEAASESETEADEEAEPVAEEPVDAGPAAETPEPDDVAAEAAPEDAEPEEATDEMYELSEEEREEVKENYGVEFSTGTEIPEGEGAEGAEEAQASTEGEAGSETEQGEEAASGGETEESEDEDEDELGDFDADDEAFDESQEDSDTTTDFTEDEYDEPESDAADAEGSEPDLDLEDYVVDLMDSLDDGDGARREDVVATAADERDADEGEIEDAIQAALMSGRCYESGDDHLKAI